VDAFPKENFTGRVSQIRMNATTVQNVVTYNTIVDFDNPEMKLFPGMTAYITIPVATAQNIMRVPNGALRYKPDMKTEEIRALYEKYGLRQSEQASDNSAPNAGGASGKQYRARNQGEQGGGAAQGDNSQERTPRMDVAVVWKLRPDKSLEPVRIRTGITDHTVTEVAQVMNGQLNEGDQLVTGGMTASSSSRPPGMGGGAPRR
jgi:HlyD family secretion protein